MKVLEIHVYQAVRIGNKMYSHFNAAAAEHSAKKFEFKDGLVWIESGSETTVVPLANIAFFKVESEAKKAPAKKKEESAA